MVSRPTISDLAKAAGVSIATVDRVINGRHKVREETSRRVHDAAMEIGFLNNKLPQPLESAPITEYRLGFVLQRPKSVFFRAVAREIENAVQSTPGIRGIVQIEFAADESAAAAVGLLKEMARDNQAIALAAPDYPAISVAVEELQAQGIPLISLLSDVAPGVRTGYVGVNNRKVGRTAAWMIARMAKRAGKVAIIVGSHRVQVHELREIGFRSFFRERAPEFEVLDTLIDVETSEGTFELTANLLRRHPDLVGLYLTGGSIEGAIEAVRAAERGRDLQVVVSELTPESRAALADEVIVMAISTPLQTLCRELVRLMITAIDKGPASVPGQTFLVPEIYLPENI